MKNANNPADRSGDDMKRACPHCGIDLDDAPPRGVWLSPGEVRIFNLWRQRSWASSDELAEAADVHVKSLVVLIHNIRRKFAEVGLFIPTGKVGGGRGGYEKLVVRKLESAA